MTTTTDRGFTLTRVLPAPRAAVYAAWTEPERLRWFAGVERGVDFEPSVNLRVGGAWRVHLYQPDGVDYFTGGVYREIVPGERLVFAWGAVGGWPALDPGRLDEVPLITVTFADATLPGGRTGTEMTVAFGFAESVTAEEVERWFGLGVRAGMSATLDRLAPALA
ncbi:SRPBCC domain-containing protein [Antribacter sp. KLBMP9083]|uniref:SRPBCC domain-containing protein n=1 Tax=Antribacter soli TaxID=2910976 RepID=A0AA41QFW7_9MICO|nr:SRPBCC domain-containing protein [Antribacter soli]MCF4121437.1 SRPBCC domain-containing protein [Antribacter soli]